ncbi:hypothetical protein INT44_003020 [Umbelopsis vinacea]|uniref:Uncharacterized protein n=1 Tax=Umbelopsis vinacea TaxID=44442 RepID=A0A8H7Q5C0_9FUNG|nr:hypothetical protein INT44_003020 [Umbelopsis vinacea]
MSKLIDENVRRHAEENNMKQNMKAVYAQSQATSTGFYAQRLSKNNNYIIPALPRLAPQ